MQLYKQKGLCCQHRWTDSPKDAMMVLLFYKKVPQAAAKDSAALGRFLFARLCKEGFC